MKKLMMDNLFNEWTGTTVPSEAAVHKAAIDAGLTQEEALNAKQAYANEMDFVLAVNNVSRMTQEEYLRQRNIYFPTTGEKHTQIAVKAKLRADASMLKDISAGSLAIGLKEDDLSKQKRGEFIREGVVVDWSIDPVDGEDVFKFGKSTYKMLADGGVVNPKTKKPYKVGTPLKYRDVIDKFILGNREDEFADNARRKIQVNALNKRSGTLIDSIK
jgi:hypothetical protein